MRREGIPLFTLESWRPVREVDLLGITLQAELTYSNVLEVLDLSGIPIRAADRGEGDPIVIGGGPSASNPAPMAPFFDAVFMGESEEAFELVLDAIDAGGGRSARLARLSELPCVYVPGRGKHEVERAIFAEFGIESQPTRVVVPYSSAIFARASVEVMRGCTRGCRFCPTPAPGTDRCVSGTADEVIKAGLEQLSCTGYDELSPDVAGDQPLHGRDRGHRRDQGRAGRNCTSRFHPTGSIQGPWP